jgi:hypothetical protein
VVEEGVGGDNCCEFPDLIGGGGSGARRSGRVVGRLILISLDVGGVVVVISDDVDDDDDEELIDVLSNFSLNSRIRLLPDHLTPLSGLLGVSL